jgi:hypothetical protein
MDRPMKILGGGELSTALFVVADAFTASARAKIESAGGTVSVLEMPTGKLAALGLDDDHDASSEPEEAPTAEAAPAETAEPAEPAETEAAPAASQPKARKPKAAKTDDAEADA